MPSRSALILSRAGQVSAQTVRSKNAKWTWKLGLNSSKPNLVLPRGGWHVGSSKRRKQEKAIVFSITALIESIVDAITFNIFK